MKSAGYSKGAELAHDYAQAAYQHTTEGWLSILKKVWEKLRVSPPLMQALNDAELPFSERQSRLDTLLPENTSEDVKNYLYVMLRDGHLELLADVIADMNRLAVRGPSVRLAHIVSAVPLTGEESEAVREKLRKSFGDQVDLQFEVDPSILGGLIVRVGDKVIDGSLENRLETLHSRLRKIR